MCIHIRVCGDKSVSVYKKGLIEWCTSGKELIVVQMVRLSGRDQKVIPLASCKIKKIEDMYGVIEVWKSSLEPKAFHGYSYNLPLG